MEVILTSSQKGLVSLLDLRRGLTLRQYRQTPPTKKGCVTPLGDYFFFISSDQKETNTGIKTTLNSKTAAWSFDTETIHSHSFVPHPISALTGSPCGRYMFGGTPEGTLLVWHTPSGRQIHIFPNFYQSITAMTVSPNLEFLALGCSDGIIHVIRLATLIGNSVKRNPFVNRSDPNSSDPSEPNQNIPNSSPEIEKLTLMNHSLPITDLRFSLTSRRLGSTSLDQTCKVWALPTGTLVCSVLFPTILNCVALGPMEDSLYVGGVDGNIYKVDFWSVPNTDFSFMDNYQKLPQIFKGNNSINSIDLNLDGSLLVSGSDDGSIRVWSSSTCQLIQTIQQHKGPINYVKVMFKSTLEMGPGLQGTTKTWTPPLLPLSPLPYVPPDSDVLPVQLPPTNMDNKKCTLMEYQQNKKITENIKNTTNQLKKIGNDNVFEEVSSLKQEVLNLKEVNSRWKAINNQLLSNTLL